MKNRIFKLILEDKKSKEKTILIMGDNYKRFEDHFLDLVSHYTEKWDYDDSPEGKGKCNGRVMEVDFLDLFESNERFVSFGGLKWTTEERYNGYVKEHNSKGSAYKPCKRLEEIQFKQSLEKLRKLKQDCRIYK